MFFKSSLTRLLLLSSALSLTLENAFLHAASAPTSNYLAAPTSEMNSSNKQPGAQTQPPSHKKKQKKKKRKQKKSSTQEHSKKTPKKSSPNKGKKSKHPSSKGKQSTHPHHKKKSQTATPGSKEEKTEKSKKASKEKKKLDKNAVGMGPIQGIVLTSDENCIYPQGCPWRRGISTENLCLPGSFCDLYKVLQPFLGKNLNKSNLQEIKKAVVKYFKDNDVSVINITLPQQSLKCQVVQVIVKSYRAGCLIFKGNQWFATPLLRKYIHLRRGDKIYEEDVLNDVGWLNYNPFHRTSVDFKPSKKDPDVVDVTFTTKDRDPFRLTVGIDNTGNPATGNARFSGGFSCGNAFMRNDIMTFLYTTSNEPGRFSSYKLNYNILFPWRKKHQINLLTTFTTSRPEVLKARSTAQSSQVRFRYMIGVPPFYKQITRNWSLGVDYKNTNSNLLSLTANPETQVIGPPIFKDINIVQFNVGYSLLNIVQRKVLYKGKKKNLTDRYTLSWTVTGSPGELMANQNDAAFNKLRPHSSSRYAYGYLTAGMIYGLANDCSIGTLFTVQLATNTLPATELFGIGGYNLVRGYIERQINTDNGAIFNGEFRFPLGGIFGKCDPKSPENLFGLVFLDIGWGGNYYRQGNLTSQYLIGIGPGIRYTFGSYFSLRMDYGIKAHHYAPLAPGAFGVGGVGRFHIGLLANY